MNEMSCWIIYPSVDPVKGLACRDRWRARGYKVAIAVDQDKPLMVADLMLRLNRPWEGYYRHINELVREVFTDDPAAQTITCIGDDMDPDPKLSAQDIAARYFERFPDGDGVLQACGDPQGQESWASYVGRLPEVATLYPVPPKSVPAAARICGSPTFGRGWIERGPFCSEYHVYYGDEDLWNVARLAGKLYLDPEITCWHHHWTFENLPCPDYNLKNSERWWEKDQKTFFTRRLKGFPRA